MKRPDMSRDTSKMSLDDLRAYNRELAAYLRQLLADRRAELEQQPAPTPEPAPVVSDAPQYALPTKRMEKAIARFDALDDAEQLDALRGMGW